jgi:hypothetical protein
VAALQFNWSTKMAHCEEMAAELRTKIEASGRTVKSDATWSFAGYNPVNSSLRASHKTTISISTPAHTHTHTHIHTLAGATHIYTHTHTSLQPWTLPWLRTNEILWELEGQEAKQ